MPPLRDRVEDIPALSREIMSRVARANDRNLSILSTSALNKLRQYSWPYNVRELESVLQKAMETAPDVVVSENDISFDTMIKDSRSPDGAMGLAGLTMAEIELADEHEACAKPEWLGEEVTGDTRYFNSMLMKNPYKSWK